MKKITLFTLLLIAGFTGFAQTTMAEYTFDTDLEGWSNGADAIVVQDATNYFTAAGSLSLTGLNNKIAKSDNISVPDAGEYTLTYKVKGDGSDPQVLRTQYKYGSDGAAQLGDDSVIGTETGGDGANTWQSYSSTFTLDGSQTTVQIQLKIKTADSFYYIDDVKLVKEPCSGFVVTADVVGGGTNVITTPLPCYPNGTEVEFTATPITHWAFDNFSGALTGATNPQTLTVGADATVTANFSVIGGFVYDFTFDTDGDAEGWAKVVNSDVLVVAGGNMTLTTSVDRFSKVDLLNFPIPTASYQYVNITLQNTSTLNDQLNVIVKNGTDTETLSQVMTVEDTGMKTYQFDLATFPTLWTGDISNFAFRFGDTDNTDPGESGEAADMIIDRIEFNNTQILGINDVDFRDDASITLYPNPVSDVFRIDSPLAIKKVEVFNLLGQKTMTTFSETVDASGLAKGVYIIKIHQENDIISTKRFIKQ